jgi:hypothetical protein
MLAPQFSLRRMLAWVSVSALVCLIGAAAARGQLWAVGVLIALAGFVLVLVVHGATFTLLRLISLGRDRRRHARQAAAAPKSMPS